MERRSKHPRSELDTWYDIKIDWCRDGTSWEGLADRKFQIAINGTSSGPLTYYNNNNYDPTHFYLGTTGTHTQDYTMYYDALSFSWDEGYDEDECLKLSPYEYNSTLDTEELGCYLDYFELQFSRYLQPNNSDSDGDGILDGVEMGVLVKGTDIIDAEDYYYFNNLTQNFIGNFSGLYSFAEEADGTTNTNINFIDSISADSSCVATIVSEYEYHNKVLALSDDNSGGKVYAYHTSFDRQNGTIEFWWAQTADDQDSKMSLYDDGTGTALTLYMRDTGKFAWYDGSYHDVGDYEESVWYHHKIVFNCSEGSKGKFSWYINGTLEAENIDFEDNCQSLNKLLLGTDSGSSGYDVYFDAIGFTWNWTYWEGQNYEKQLPDDTTIGQYPAAYSFTEEIGETGTNIDLVDSNTFESCEIISSLDGHEAILELESYGVAWKSFYDSISDQESGTIEYWLRVDTVGYYVQRLLIYHGSTPIMNFYLHNDGKMYYNDGTARYLRDYEINTWYHVRIDFECGNGGYQGLSADDLHIYVDGVHYGDYNFINNAEHIDKLYWDTGTGGVTSIRYMDAVGYSWDEGYEVGGNVNYQGPELTAPEEYYLEIPHIGEVTDGQLDIEVKSDSTTEGSGKMFVQLIKERMNRTKTDIILLNYCEEFGSSQQFAFQKSIDLSPYVVSGEIYGTYYLKVQAFSTKSNDLFNLTKFEIETDTYVAAEFGDYDAWVTDPARDDTDGDGLLDYEEIFINGTNPNAADTDGDGAWDNEDVDPLRDMMLEIRPSHAFVTSTPNVLWQIVINCSFIAEDYVITTPCEDVAETSPYYMANFSEYRYYINTDDEEDFYGDEVLIPLELWMVKRHLGLDDFIMLEQMYYTDNCWYDFTDPETQQIWTVEDCAVFIDVTQFYIEKANTLAIYEVNSTFTGRYQDRNQGYSIIQLQIPDEGHYFGSESFLDEQIGSNSSVIAFVDEDDSDSENMVSIVEKVGDHTNVLSLQEGYTQHADITHNLGTRTIGTIEWWWRSTDADNGISYVYLKNYDDDAIRLSMTDNKLKYYDGSWQDIMTVASNIWYRMKLTFVCKIGSMPVYSFDLSVNDVLELGDTGFYSNENTVNKLQISTSGYACNHYFDAFGFSWDSDYNIGDNKLTYSVEGTPFEHGMNVIVLPTELLTHSLLNGYIETGNLDQTPLYHSDENIFQVTGIERNGEPKPANSDAELSIYRRNISPSDAMEVLDLILKGLLNETWEEDDAIFLHSYVCTKVNGTTAIQMNLPFTVLGFVPWFNTLSNSKMGDKPMPEGAWNFELWLDCLLNPYIAASFHAQMATTGGEFYHYLEGYVSVIKMAIITFLGDLLWTIIRAVLLVLIYVLLAIELIFISIKILVMGAALFVFSLFLEVQIEFGITFTLEYGIDNCVGFINIINDDSHTRLETWITWIYWEYFDLYIPWITDKTLKEDVVITRIDQSVLSSETKENSEENLPLIASSEEKLPQLSYDCNDVLDNEHFEFNVYYFDANLLAPESNYGVQLHLIAPNGTALDSIEMDKDGKSVDFDEGFVLYNESVDISGFGNGLWHYFFTTKDSSTNEIVKFPEFGYILGPQTTNQSSYMMSQRIIVSEEDYHIEEAWVDDDLTFIVDWYDMINYTSPQKINLCLIPANKSIATGVSKRVGITKLEMNPSVINPNYSLPVEYNVSINFDDEGYGDFDIGEFSYYFEAELDNATIYFYRFDSSDGRFADFEGPLIMSVNHPTLSLECYSINADSPNMLTDNSAVTYLLTYFDPQGVPSSSIPKIIFNSTGEIYEYEMTSIVNSTDGKSNTYVLTAYSSDMKAGSYTPILELPEDWRDISHFDLPNNFFTVYVLNFFEDMTLEMGSSIINYGVIPVSILTALSAVALIGGSSPYAAVAVLGGSIALLGLTIGNMITDLTRIFDSEQTGGLLGLGISSLIMFLLFRNLYDGDGGLASKIFNFAQKHLNFFLMLSLVTEFMTSIYSVNFPGDALGYDVINIFDNLVDYIPSLFIYIAFLDSFDMLMGAAKDYEAPLHSMVDSVANIYSYMLGGLALVSFIAFSTSLALDLIAIN